MNKVKKTNIWNLEKLCKPMIAVVFGSTVAADHLPFNRVTCWQLTRMKYHPTIQVWVRWVPDAKYALHMNDNLDVYINALPLEVVLDVDGEEFFNGGFKF